MESKDILKEGFFSKTSKTDKFKNKLPEYTPDSSLTPGGVGYGSVLSTDKDGNLIVSNAKEAGKRLTKSLGAIIGNNSIKSAASRSLKTFPILISDAVDPETAVMIKKLMEEQYADYIQLLISNQIIDLTKIEAGNIDKGNVAIQAVDTMIGKDQSNRIADKLSKGDLSLDNLVQGQEWYELIRNESFDYGDSLLNSLLEDAVVVDSKYSDALVMALNEGYDDNNHDTNRTPVGPKGNKKSLDDALNGIVYGDDDRDIEAANKKIQKMLDLEINRQQLGDLNRGYIAGIEDDKGNYAEIYNKISTADVFVDDRALTLAMNKTVGETLNMRGNEELKSRFEKAAFLLQSRLISGAEYIAYLNLRLGIPVSLNARRAILANYRSGDVQATGLNKTYISLKDMEKALTSASAQKETKRTAHIIAIINGTKMKQVATWSAGLGLAATGAGITVAILANPLIGGLLIASGIIGIGVSIYKLLKYRSARKTVDGKIKLGDKFVGNKTSSPYQGWERVEALIDTIENNKTDLTIHSINKTADNEEKLKAARGAIALRQKENELINKMDDEATQKIGQLKTVSSSFEDTGYQGSDITLGQYYEYYKSSPYYQNIKPVLESNVFDVITESVTFDGADEAYNDDTFSAWMDSLNESWIDLQEDEDFKGMLLAEKLVEKTYEVKPKIRYQYDTNAKPEIEYVPAFTSRSKQGYGSVEIDRRDLKDRKYNAPLLIKVSFKERLDDGTFTDNELSAIIGIQGVLQRVPTDEMKYILKTNAEGKIFDIPGLDNLTNSVTDLLTPSKIANDLKNLPQSSDAWAGLEKVARMAVVNKLAGKDNDTPANAHIVFSQSEIDAVKVENGADYLKDKKLAVSLMKKYGAFTIMIANDVSTKLYILDDPSKINWDVVPYIALRNKDTGDSLAALAQILRR